MHRKKYLRMIAAWAIAACMMTASAGSFTVYAKGAQESERIKIGSDFSKRQTEETVSGSKAAAWFVGPEGGFTETEEKQMLEAGVQPLHFGNWVLRVETAAVCGLCLIHEMNRH